MGGLATPPHHLGREPYAVGFELELYGIHDHPAHVPEAGCDECRIVYRALRELAEAILPPPDRASRYDISFFDHSLHYARRHRMRGEVRLTIAVLHRHGYDRPVDACEVTCLHEMEAKLAQLGARKG